MKKKILGILVCMLFVISAFTSAANVKYSLEEKTVSNNDSNVGQNEK